MAGCLTTSSEKLCFKYDFARSGTASEFCLACDSATHWRKYDLTCVANATYCGPDSDTTATTGLNLGATTNFERYTLVTSGDITKTGATSAFGTEKRCQCNSGYGFNSNWDCQPCNIANCATCGFDDGEVKCLTCSSAGYALNKVNGTCEKCPPNCATCQFKHYIHTEEAATALTVIPPNSECDRPRLICLTCSDTTT